LATSDNVNMIMEGINQRSKGGRAGAGKSLERKPATKATNEFRPAAQMTRVDDDVWMRNRMWRYGTSLAEHGDKTRGRYATRNDPKFTPRKRLTLVVLVAAGVGPIGRMR